MKTILLLAIVAITFASCSKNETTSDPLADLTTNTNMVAQSDWKITQYTDSGNDETSDYTTYSFTFKTDGTFIAVSTDGTFNGTWALAAASTTPDDSGDDVGEDKFS